MLPFVGSPSGISRDSTHKRRLTGGKKIAMRKKRKFELGRQPANTKIGPKHVNLVRVRGGHYKFRALRLETGNFSWASESTSSQFLEFFGSDHSSTSVLRDPFVSHLVNCRINVILVLLC
jgi:ribosomal protein eS8